MTVVVTLKGALEPVILDEDFLGMANQLNMAGASGRQFVVFDDDEGGPVLLSLSQILTAKEVEGDVESLLR